MSFMNIGALTSVSTRYSQRMWEFEKIESYDPFETSGSSISYSVHGNNIIRVGHIPSLNTSWCTDKIRYYVDCFNLISYSNSISNSLFGVVSWSECAKYLCSYIYLSYLYNYICEGKRYNFLSYDVYSNNSQLSIVLNFIRYHGNITINNFIIFYNIPLMLYVGSFCMINISNVIFSQLVFYCSYMDISYPYLYMYVSGRIYNLHIVGFLHKKSNNCIHHYLGFVGFYKNMLSNFNYENIFLYDIMFFGKISIDSICNFTYIYTSLGKIISLMIVFSYMCEIKHAISLLSPFLYSFYINKYRFIVPYSYCFFEIITDLFSYDFIQHGSYLHFYYDFTHTLPLYSNHVSISFLHFRQVNIYASDIVIPIFTHLHTYNFNLDMYGVLTYHSKVLSNSLLFDNKIFFMFYLYLSNNVMNYKFSTDIRLLYLSHNVFSCSRLNIVTVVFYFFLLNILSLVYCNILYHSITTFNFINFNLYYCYIYSSPALNDMNIFISYSNYYVDQSTYFLTGSMCKISNFLSRYREIHNIGTYTLCNI